MFSVRRLQALSIHLQSLRDYKTQEMYLTLYRRFFEEEDNEVDETDATPARRSNADHFFLQPIAAGLKRTVGYIHSPEHLFECSRLPKVRGRSLLVHGLIKAYGLLPHLHTIPPTPATASQLKAFHSEDYIDFLVSCEQCEDLEREDVVNAAKEYNLVDDCPLVKRLYTIVRYIAGGTLTACRALIDGTCNTVVHWEGGWHHAQRTEAAGFCYVNDVVLGIQELYRHFGRVLYVDLDVHHGDGVQDAFYATDKVLTLSFHCHELGFYPGTGLLNEHGYGRGKGYALNVPLRDGIRDSAFISVATKVLDTVLARYQPNAIVCQCGADGLSGDPLGTFNLTPIAFAECLRLLMSTQMPLLVLGGGGYIPANAARCWTQLTAALMGIELADDIPYHCFLLKYGPGYELRIGPGWRTDFNDLEYLDKITKNVLGIVEVIERPPTRDICASTNPRSSAGGQNVSQQYAESQSSTQNWTKLRSREETRPGGRPSNVP